MAPKPGGFYFLKPNGHPASGHIVLLLAAPEECYGDVQILRTTSFSSRSLQDALSHLPKRRRYHLPLGHTPQVEFSHPLLSPLKTTKPDTFGPENSSLSYLFVAQAYVFPVNILEPCAADRNNTLTQLEPNEYSRVLQLHCGILAGKIPPAVAPLVTQRPPPSPTAQTLVSTPPSSENSTSALFARQESSVLDQQNTGGTPTFANSMSPTDETDSAQDQWAYAARTGREEDTEFIQMAMVAQKECIERADVDASDNLRRLDAEAEIADTSFWDRVSECCYGWEEEPNNAGEADPFAQPLYPCITICSH